MAVHRGNGGMATRLGCSMRLLDPSLLLGLMQHVEIVAELERRFGWSPMGDAVRPVTRSQFSTLLRARVDSGKKAAE